MDVRDWLVVLLVAVTWIAATAFLFTHPDVANFATWAAVISTVTGLYHFLVVRDSKIPDAPQ
jgi:hypothetical protein